MKKIITLLALVSTIAFAAILSNGCSKKLTKGTLKIKNLSNNGIAIYPYVADYNKLKPIFSSTKAKTSFDLNPGNYMIKSSDSTIAVQIQVGETINLILTDYGFAIDEFP